MNATNTLQDLLTDLPDDRLRAYTRLALTAYDAEEGRAEREGSVARLMAALQERARRIEANGEDRPTHFAIPGNRDCMLKPDGTYQTPISDRSSAFDFPEDEPWHPRVYEALKVADARAERMAPVRAAAEHTTVVAALAEFVAEHFPHGMEARETGELYSPKTGDTFDRGLTAEQAKLLADAVNLYT